MKFSFILLLLLSNCNVAFAHSCEIFLHGIEVRKISRFQISDDDWTRYSGAIGILESVLAEQLVPGFFFFPLQLDQKKRVMVRRFEKLKSVDKWKYDDRHSKIVIDNVNRVQKEIIRAFQGTYKKIEVILKPKLDLPDVNSLLIVIYNDSNKEIGAVEIDVTSMLTHPEILYVVLQKPIFHPVDNLRRAHSAFANIKYLDKSSQIDLNTTLDELASILGTRFGAKGDANYIPTMLSEPFTAIPKFELKMDPKEYTNFVSGHQKNIEQALRAWTLNRNKRLDYISSVLVSWFEELESKSPAYYQDAVRIFREAVELILKQTPDHEILNKLEHELLLLNKLATTYGLKSIALKLIEILSLGMHEETIRIKVHSKIPFNSSSSIRPNDRDLRDMSSLEKHFDVFARKTDNKSYFVSEVDMAFSDSMHGLPSVKIFKSDKTQHFRVDQIQEKVFAVGHAGAIGFGGKRSNTSSSNRYYGIVLPKGIIGRMSYKELFIPKTPRGISYRDLLSSGKAFLVRKESDRKQIHFNRKVVIETDSDSIDQFSLIRRLSIAVVEFNQDGDILRAKIFD